MHQTRATGESTSVAGTWPATRSPYCLVLVAAPHRLFEVPCPSSPQWLVLLAGTPGLLVVPWLGAPIWLVLVACPLMGSLSFQAVHWVLHVDVPFVSGPLGLVHPVRTNPLNPLII